MLLLVVTSIRHSSVTFITDTSMKGEAEVEGEDMVEVIATNLGGCGRAFVVPVFKR